MFYHFKFAFPVDTFHALALCFRAASKSDFQETGIRIVGEVC